MEPFISTFDIKWKTIELAGSKDNCCFHFIFQLNHACSSSLFGWPGDSGCISLSRQHDVCHHRKSTCIFIFSNAEPHCLQLQAVSMTFTRSIQIWLLLVTTSVPPKNTSILINWSLVLWNIFKLTIIFPFPNITQIRVTHQMLSCSDVKLK